MTYYNTQEEVPTTIKLIFPKEENKEPITIDINDIDKYSEYGYIKHHCNYGCCDFWDYTPLSDIKTDFNTMVKVTDICGDFKGWMRKTGDSVLLSKDKNYHKSEVWNS